MIQATLNDLPEAAHLFDQYRMFYKQRSDLEGAKHFIQDRLVQGDSIIFLVKDPESNRSVAFCQLYPTYSSISMQRSWILNDLFVEEQFRKLGVSKLLLDYAAGYAKQTNAKGLELATAMDNIRAQKIYEKHGYEKDEAFYHYYLKV